MSDSSLVSSQDFFCSIPRVQSRYVTPRLIGCYFSMYLHFACYAFFPAIIMTIVIIGVLSPRPPQRGLREAHNIVGASEGPPRNIKLFKFPT